MMNSAQHTRYSCPVCSGSENCYLSCNRPDCPDGRDRGHPHHALHQPAREVVGVSRTTPVWPFLLALALAALLFGFLAGKAAHALDHGFNPNDKTVRWFESLMMPDGPASCCGKADAYPLSDYWANSDGTDTWTVVVAEGSHRVYPDGTVRPYIAAGTQIIVPGRKMNRWEDDLDNPTDTSWVFMSVYGGVPGTVYCVIRHPQGN